MEERTDDLHVPVIREGIDVSKTAVETGRVTVRTQVVERQEPVELSLEQEEYTVERVEVNRPVDAPVQVRHDGDTMIVPVHAEEIVVTRRLLLKEELHIRRHVHERRETQHVTLRSQDVEVVRESAPPSTAGPSGTH